MNKIISPSFIIHLSSFAFFFILHNSSLIFERNLTHDKHQTPLINR